MSANTEGLLNKLPAVTACLCGETRVHSNDLMTSSCSLIFKDVEKRAPTGVHDALGKMVIFHHIGDLKVFHGNVVILFSVPFGGLEMVISALSIDFQMRFSNVASSCTASVTALLATAQLTLFASQSALRGAIEARIVNRLAFTISQERFQSNINTDVSMGTGAGGMLGLRFSLTDDKRVPVPISTQDKMYCFGFALYPSVQLDFEEVSQLLGDNQVFLVLMQIAIFAILPELDGMPAVGLLETWEADPRNSVLLGGKKAFERLGEAISKHLYRCSWYVLTLPFECRFKLILTWECPIALILCRDFLKHSIEDDVRLGEAGHELAGLLLIHEQAVLKCSHVHILPDSIRIVK